VRFLTKFCRYIPGLVKIEQKLITSLMKISKRFCARLKAKSHQTRKLLSKGEKYIWKKRYREKRNAFYGHYSFFISLTFFEMTKEREVKELKWLV
jgi:hypothetical protein